ncbi:peptidoglycan recognition protein [Streptomyces sp. B8F3]|uniref:peptidoglycan recognition protein family protein n=1 Tax=Streptomyces sp. B8F3 TaxID=3153573 RepID=UPI00325E8FA9
MRGVCGPYRHRRPLRWAVAGAGATVAAALTAGSLTGTLSFGDGPGSGERPPKAAPSPHTPADALQPPIVARAQWRADPKLLDQKPRYADAVHAVVLHHTGHSNDYDCSDSPHLVRDMYRTHAVARDWGDLGYNFLVDRCGTIFEGRKGGVDRPVVGAHTIGINTGTTGIAAIGTFTEGAPVPKALRKSVEMLIAWKLGLTGIAPEARSQLISSNSSSRFTKGSTVSVPTVLGHIDAYETTCPGKALAQLLPALRKGAARLQSKAKVQIRKEGGRPRNKKAEGAARRAPSGHARIGGTAGSA